MGDDDTRAATGRLGMVEAGYPKLPQALSMDAATIRRWSSAALDALGAHRDEIDQLNVFPVPDGDTGSNMLLTVRAMNDALRRERPAHLNQAAAVVARGALLGARGNSGVILSQYIRGLAQVLAQLPDGGIVQQPGLVLAEALARGSSLAAAAVAEPAPGTMLTVAARVAERAMLVAKDAIAGPAALAAVATAAAAEAAQAVLDTRTQNPTLRRAGVVDAGGRGLSIVIDAIAAVTGGNPAGGAAWARRDSAAPASRSEVQECSSTFSYEVIYLIDSAADAVDGLRERLADIGDSIVIASADLASPPAGLVPATTWRVHVHANDVGAAIERGVEIGSPRQIEVTRFADQTAPFAAGRTGVGVVAIAPGAALRDAFLGEGALVVDSGPNRRPSTAEVLAAVIATASAHVVILPNDRDCEAVADVAADEARGLGYDVAVVPTKSVMQGLAAIAVHDGERRFSDNVIAMAEAAAATRFADLSVAEHEALTMVGPCRRGDVIGSVEYEVVAIGSSILEVALELLDRFLATGGELVSIAVSPSAPAELADDLRRDVLTRHPEIEVSVLGGGHPDYVLLMGVE